MKTLRIYQSPEDKPLKGRKPVVRHFGGIKVYGATQKDLDSDTAAVFDSILRVGEKSAGLNISLYKYLVGEDLGLEIPKRLFSALLGRQLRDGNLDAVICEGSMGTMFRVVFARNRLMEYQGRVAQVETSLVREKTIAISKIRDMFFKKEQEGDWTKAMYIASRLVRLGAAVFDDRFNISMPSMIQNAHQLADR